MSDETITPLKRFWRLLKPDQQEITNVYVYSIFNGLVNLSLPLGIQAIINFIQSGRVSTSWIVLVFIVVSGVAITGVLQIFQLRITENLQQKIFARSAFDFAYRMPRMKMEELYRHYAPELMNRFFDIISVQKGLSKILIDFSTALLQVLFGLILLSLYHPFFIIFSVVLFILLYGIFRITGRQGLATSLKESKYKYQVAHWLEEVARTHITFKLAGKTDLPLTNVNEKVEKYIHSRESHFKVLVKQYSLLVFFKVLVATSLLAIGGILVIDQQMNIGQFVAAEIIILLVMNSVEKLILSMETIYDILTSLEKIGQVTDLELEKSGNMDIISECKTEGLKVDMVDVQFSYPGQTKKTLNKFNLSIPSGQKLVINGCNGVGKSTLLHLLSGLYEIQEGTISYDGLPKSNLDINSLRSIIGDYLSQEDLFEASLLENITMGRPEATFDRVKWCIKNLGLEPFINELPEAFDTILGPEGKKLPRNIIQRLLIARSIVVQPKLLLLEDAFEHIQAEDKKQIIDFLMDSNNPWTLVAVSNNNYVAQKSDRVVVMDNGANILSGTYDEVKNHSSFKKD